MESFPKHFLRTQSIVSQYRLQWMMSENSTFLRTQSTVSQYRLQWMMSENSTVESFGRKILLIVFLFCTLHLIASGNLNHIQQNKMILGASVHQELEQQMPSSDIPSKILCQVIKIDLQQREFTGTNPELLKPAERCTDMQQQTPCQQLIAKDLHGNEWNFQHVNQSLECTKRWSLAILVLDDKNEPMITMDTPEEENADADYLLRCIIALYTFCPCGGSTRISKEREFTMRADFTAEDTIDSFLFYTLHLIASRNLNHIQQNKMILGAWVHQVLEQQMPSSDIPSKILCQVIKIDLQDMQRQTPCQQLIPKDLHGNEWHFQHVNQIFVCELLLRPEGRNAQNGGALAILVLDDKSEQMITMDTLNKKMPMLTICQDV
ncbi:hypothetical protein GH714_001906 [Hevea brasiliensis]|uniref:Uncharacterized protein n=1 Tax=Hevea brasiliensis TaxID=3981 RepID=A0A6A6MAZ9_HEVBR|nr:hypothetical protein GH714_001906 [Hevea brasiliensis]